MKTALIIILSVMILGGASYGIWRYSKRPNQNQTATPTATNQTTKTGWREKGVAVAGKYADAEVADLGGGKYRLYYSVEPEVADNNLEVYSSTSTDGITWTKEDGVRKIMATFPDIVKLPDGKWRMYFQNAGEIKSAISTDGLAWQNEPGVRINKTEESYEIDNVGAQTTMLLADNTYLMVYRGMIDKPYETAEKIPNQNMQLFFYAISTDGLNFTKKGLALDSRNDTLYGLADGAELVRWDNDQLRLYFWSYSGVYHIVYQNNKFTTASEFDFTNKQNSQNKFPQNPPSDPTLIKIGQVWYMYYGQHTQGIYYATLSQS